MYIVKYDTKGNMFLTNKQKNNQPFKLSTKNTLAFINAKRGA